MLRAGVGRNASLSHGRASDSRGGGIDLYVAAKGDIRSFNRWDSRLKDHVCLRGGRGLARLRATAIRFGTDKMPKGTSVDTTQERGARPSQSGGEPCPGCQRATPVRAKRPDEVTTHWECTGCQSPMTGVLMKDAAPLLAAHIHLGQRHFDTTGLPPIAPALRQLVQEFLIRRRDQGNPPDERRKSVRVPQQLDVVVVPLSEEWTPVGKPILGIVVDLAAHGLGMITTANVGAPYVVAQIRHGNSFVQLLGRIAWSKDFGHGFHNAGVQFVVRFGRDATSK